MESTGTNSPQKTPIGKRSENALILFGGMIGFALGAFVMLVVCLMLIASLT